MKGTNLRRVPALLLALACLAAAALLAADDAGARPPEPARAAAAAARCRTEACRWRRHFRAQPASWRGWALRTAYCETGGKMDPAIHDPSGRYHGLGQFDLRTWREAGGWGDPHRASRWEQLSRMIRLARRVGTGRWPVCG